MTDIRSSNGAVSDGVLRRFRWLLLVAAISVVLLSVALRVWNSKSHRESPSNDSGSRWLQSPPERASDPDRNIRPGPLTIASWNTNDNNQNLNEVFRSLEAISAGPSMKPDRWTMNLYKVEQLLISRPLPEIVSTVQRQLTSLNCPVPQGEVAITVGSRGIRNLSTIIRACGQWLKEHGAQPFIVPAMGSHNGATAEGQRNMVESLGVTESAMDMPIRSSMEVVEIGHVRTGTVFMDRHCYEAAGVLVVNRIKLHTCFSGPIQSGLTKMMVVGMGKIRSAQTFHSARAGAMKDKLLEMGQYVLDSGRIFAGLGILEDGFDDTTELHAIAPQDILEREAQLLEHHRSFFPRLPIDDLNVLIVDAIGKTYSGTGMDTNVIGRRGIPGFEDLMTPRIRVIAALSLSASSQGNALGVGNADFITQRLRSEIDESRTLVNTLTTGDMDRAKIPATVGDEESLIRLVAERFGEHRWMFIPNTLHLGELYVSADLRAELAANPICRVSEAPTKLTFQNGRHQLTYSAGPTWA